MPFKPTQHVASRLRIDRAVKVGDMRTIKHESQYEPDERVIEFTLELTASEIRELEYAIQNHVKHMDKKQYVYSELKTVQRLLGRAHAALFDSKKPTLCYNADN